MMPPLEGPLDEPSEASSCLATPKGWQIPKGGHQSLEPIVVQRGKQGLLRLGAFDAELFGVGGVEVGGELHVEVANPRGSAPEPTKIVVKHAPAAHLEPDTDACDGNP
jgi:hypothetical protein